MVDLKRFESSLVRLVAKHGAELGLGDVPLFPRDLSTQEIYAFDLHPP